MKFGLLYEMQRPHGDDFDIDYTALIDETLEQCILDDEVGFDYLWFVEHHFLTSFSGSSAPEVIISSLAKLTTRIRLGVGVVVLRTIILCRWRSVWPWWTTYPGGAWSSA